MCSLLDFPNFSKEIGFFLFMIKFRQIFSTRQNIIFSCLHINKWFKTLSNLWNTGLKSYPNFYFQMVSKIRSYVCQIQSKPIKNLEPHTPNKHSDEKLGIPTSITIRHILTKYQMGSPIAHHPPCDMNSTQFLVI